MSEEPPAGDGPDPAAGAARAFRELTGRDPEGVWSAPGRVNLIGEHTDYNGGCVLPFAIHLRTAVAAARRRDGWIRAVSRQAGGQELAAPVDSLAPGSGAAAGSGWTRHAAGVVWSLRRAGCPLDAGADLLVDGAVPAGSGLSSSAALECAIAGALAELSRWDPSGTRPADGSAGTDPLDDDPRHRLARLAQIAENDFVGAPCGLMDQMVAMAATAGHALLFDAAAGRVEQIPFDPAAAELSVLVADSRVRHDHAAGGYRDRRNDCARAALLLGVSQLTDLSPADLDGALRRLDDVTGRRVRHVVSEQARTRDAVRLLRTGRIGDIGPLLDASHRSLRDDFEVSTPELNALVEAARRAGAVGARLTGGGFGGSVIALVPEDRVSPVAAAMSSALAGTAAGGPLSVMTVTPSDGARRDIPPRRSEGAG